MIKIFNRLKSEIGELRDVINMSYKKPFNSLMTAELTIKADNPAIMHLQPFNFIEVTDDFGEYIGIFRLMVASPTKEGDSATIKYSLYQAGHTLIDSAIKKSKEYTNVTAYDIVSELLTLQSHKYWVVDSSLRSIQIPLYELEVQSGLLSTIFDLVNSYSEKMVVFDTSNVWTIKVKDTPTINCRIKEGYNLTNFDIEENYLSIINRVYAYAEWSEYDNGVEIPKRVTMASVNNNKEYVENTELVNKYGVIEKVELFSEEATPKELLNVANIVLRQHTQRVKSIRVSAVDMVKASTNDLSIDLLRVGNRVFFDSDDFGTSELVIMSESKSDIFGTPEDIELEISMDKDLTSITSTIRDLKANIKGVTTIAERAIMSANGKNKVYYTPENQPPVQPQNGDIWFRDNADGTTSYLVRIADSWVDKSPNTEELEVAINNNKKIIEEAQAAANAAVKPGELFEQINRQAGNVLIRAEEGGAKLNITKDNVFMDAAVIKQANIDLATINDAFLKNVTFDWARGKTIDANEINVINLTGKNLTFDTVFVNKLKASGIGASIDLSSNQSITQTVSTQVISKLSDPEIRAQFKGEKGDQGLRGLQGETGEQGIPGKDGKPSYTHIAYADTATGGGFSQNPANKSYIGIYVDFIKEDSETPSKYKWTLIKGADGADGIPGAKGADGKTPYLHIAYANSEDGKKDFSVSDSNGSYIGQYTDYEKKDSTDPTKYTWSKIQGTDGADFTWNLLKGTKDLTIGGLTYETGSRKEYQSSKIDTDYDNLSLPANITISFDIEQNTGSPFNIIIYNDNNKGPHMFDSKGITIPDGKSRQFVHTVLKTRPNPNTTGNYIEFYSVYGTNNWYKITNLKIELGHTKNPTWSPHVSEIQGQDGANGQDGKSFTWNLLKGSNELAYTGTASDTHIPRTYIENGITHYEITKQNLTANTYTGYRAEINYSDLPKVFTVSFEVMFNDTSEMTKLSYLGHIGGLQTGKRTTSMDLLINNIGVELKENIWQKVVINVDESLFRAKTSDYDINKITSIYITLGQFFNGKVTFRKLMFNGGTVASDYAPHITEIQGQDGVAGKDGVGITSTSIEYAVNQSGTTKPTAGWSGTVPKTNPGDYIWTKTTWKYTDNTSEDSYSVGRIGANGADGNDGLPGAPGVGIKMTTITYTKSNSGTVIPPSTVTWSPSPPAGNPGEFIWTRTVWTYTDNTTEAGYSVGKIGNTGPKGADGVAGKDGVGIKTTTITYGLSTSESTQPSNWTSNVPSLVKGQYLWTKTVWAYTDGSSETGYTKTYISKDGNNGKNGIAGKDGVGIKTTVIEYAKNTSGTVKPTTGWQSQVPSVPDGEYLWTKTTWNYTDGTSETGYSVSKMGAQGIRGLQGIQGAKGDQGVAGKDGKSSYTHIAYANSSDGKSGFSASDSTNKLYVGMYVDNIQTDSKDPEKYKWTLIKGMDGKEGIPGPQGPNGQTSYLHIAYADAPADRATFSITNSSNKRCIGQYTDFKKEDSTNPGDYTWTFIKGTDGKDGTAFTWNIYKGGAILDKSRWAKHDANVLTINDEEIFFHAAKKQSNVMGYYGLNDYNNILESGKTYTVSFDAKNLRDNEVVRFTVNGFSSYSYVTLGSLEEKRVVITGVRDATQYMQIQARNTALGANLKFELRNLKIEEGTVTKTVFTPHPDEVKPDYTEFRTEFSSEIKQLSNQISSKVEAKTYDYNNKLINQNFTEIEQKANKIELSVSGKTSSSDVKNIFTSLTLTDKQIKSVTDNFVIESRSGTYRNEMKLGNFTSYKDGYKQFEVNQRGLEMYERGERVTELATTVWLGNGSNNFRLGHRNSSMTISYYNSKADAFNPYITFDKYNTSGFLSSSTYPIKITENVEMASNFLMKSGTNLWIGDSFKIYSSKQGPDDILYMVTASGRYGIGFTRNKLYFVYDNVLREVFSAK